MKTGLFFGSFNPIHNGHLHIAEYFLCETPLDEIWFIVSPHNPLKEKSVLLPFHDRLNMVRIAINNQPLFNVSDIENELPLPSYTINTLEALYKKFPFHDFVLLLGSDSLDSIHLWKDYQSILKNIEIFVYPRRSDYEIPNNYRMYSVRIFPCPIIDISSTDIRQMIDEGGQYNEMVPPDIYDYLNKLTENRSN